MESPIIETLKLDLFIAGAVIAGVVILMRFMPRLMAGVPFVEPKAVNDLMAGGKELVIIDIRTKEEYTGPLGHISGSLNLDGMELDNRLDAADKKLGSLKNEPIFVVCRTHNRSPRAARRLTQAGFTSVAIIKGGMVNWNKQELPVER